MTRQWKWVSLIIVSLTATACSTNNPSSPAATPPATTTEINKLAALEAYQAVLNNRKEFQSTDSQKAKTLNDFLSNNEVYGTTTAVDRFAVVDMDGDEVPELVLGLTVDNSDFTEVLRYREGEVYGFFFGKDQIVELKNDGSYRWLSGGMTNNGYGKLTFKADIAEPEKMAYLESRPLDETSTTFTTAYYINDNSVTKESYIAYVTEQEAKKDVSWQKRTQANIDKLSAASADSPSPK